MLDNVVKFNWPLTAVLAAINAKLATPMIALKSPQLDGTFDGLKREMQRLTSGDHGANVERQRTSPKHSEMTPDPASGRNVFVNPEGGKFAMTVKWSISAWADDMAEDLSEIEHAILASSEWMGDSATTPEELNSNNHVIKAVVAVREMRERIGRLSKGYIDGGLEFGRC